MKKLLSILLLSVCTFAQGQEYGKYIRKAESASYKGEYGTAIAYYDKALGIDREAYEANAGKGMILGEFMEQYEQAIPYLEKALGKSSKDTLLTIYYTLGRCYHYMGDYNRALYCYNKLSAYEEIGNDMFPYYLQKHIADCHYALAHQSTAPQYNITVKNAGQAINTEFPEYAPVFTPNNELIFTSKRKDDEKEKINQWDGKYFESMYISKWENGQFSEPRRYTRPDLGQQSKFSKYNESSVSVSPDGKSFFIYRMGDLYIVPLNDLQKKPEKLSKQVNMAAYQNHAALSADNNTIYFSSATDEGYGGTDIFRSVKNAQGGWSKAELLDSTVNTMFNEDAPYIAEDGTLYFSSNGHPGFGSYDIYKTHIENGRWTTPENLGQPVNSPGADIFLGMVSSKEGYYSSARKGGSGDLDIYTVQFGPALKPDTAADPLLALKPLKKENETNTSAAVSSKDKFLSGKELEKTGWNNAALYFNYNETTLRKDALAILDHNIEVMKANKNMAIVINGFSDARGPEKYNSRLSSNRAQMVKQYIISKGIDRSRIKSTEGLGEAGLLNDCGDGRECDEAQHQVNRRVEIQVLNENYKPQGVVTTGLK
ncbi:MAG: hypothetical protein JWO44_2389 [Bacteroidetes bacterium]|nr:hypothetical protein [Bacteroidota bacterium]